MQINCKTRTLQWVNTQVKNNGISLYHKLQRREGQWNRKAKALLIDSLLRNYPVNVIYTIKENNQLSIIDGIQRISTIRDYLDNEFSLSKELDPVTITVHTEHGAVEKKFEIAGRKFKKLDKELQELLLSSELQFYEISDYTEKEVRELFRRQNSGKCLNNSQSRTVIETDEMSELIYDLITHPFFEHALTEAQKKKDLDKDIVIETLMLIETDSEHNYTCFKSNSLNSFILSYQKNIPYDKITFVKQALDKLNEEFRETKIKSLSIPMILWGMYSVISCKKSATDYISWVKEFLAAYHTNDEYLQYCKSGTSGSASVTGRFQYFENAVKSIG